MTAGIAQPENTDISIDNAAGTPVALEDHLVGAGMNIEYATDGATAIADLAEDHTVGSRDPGDYDVDGLYTRTWAYHLAGIWRAVATSTFTITHEPDGVETNTGESFVTGFELNIDRNSTSKLNAKFKMTSTITTTPA